MKEYYKIAFCGMGSIGRRHFRNTVQYLQEKNCCFQIDVIRSGAGRPLEKNLEQYITKQYAVTDAVPEDYDIIFITNPTSMHWNSILQYQNCTGSMFIEKPVVHETGIPLERLREGLICYVACPLRYTKVLQYIKQNIDCEKAYSVRAVCSTYLPDWHPGEDYRKSYSAHKSMGGGVDIDLIHEWDYLVWLFGKPVCVNSIRRKISELEIDSEDIAAYIGYSDTKVYELHLDYFGKKESREAEIHLPDRCIRADIRNGLVYSYAGGQTEEILLQEERDAWQMREIAHFFDIVNGACDNDNTIAEALETMRIARGEEFVSQFMA